LTLPGTKARIDWRTRPFKEETIYAIVRSGGKQYRVDSQRVVDVERLPAQVGATVELRDVLLVGDDNKVEVGQPLVDGARVIAEVVGHGRGDKVTVFTYTAKTRQRRKRGHRQPYTRLAIRHILLGGEVPPAPEEKPKRRKASSEDVPAGEAEPRAAPSTRRRATARKPKAQGTATSETRRRRKAGSE
jgi:large subunit ribosomal protein L21